MALALMGRDVAWLRRVSPLGQNTIQRLLSEPTHRPRARTIDTVAEILGVPPAWLTSDAPQRQLTATVCITDRTVSVARPLNGLKPDQVADLQRLVGTVYAVSEGAEGMAMKFVRELEPQHLRVIVDSSKISEAFDEDACASAGRRFAELKNQMLRTLPTLFEQGMTVSN